LADLENVNADLAGNYALGKDIDASATSDGSYVPIGSGNTAFTGQFDGEGHTIRSLTLQGNTEYDWDNHPVELGVFGTLGTSAAVRDLNVDANISMIDAEWKSGTVGVEGLLAANNYGTIVRVNTSGHIDNMDNSWFDVTTAGGLVGVNHGVIERSSSNVNANIGGTFGGLVGENDGTIAQSYASGSVQSSDAEGGSESSIGTPAGFVAINNGTITQSYATTAVSNQCLFSPCAAGALVNVNRGTISQSFATGTLTGVDEAGGIAAENDGTIASDVYWDKDSTGASSGVGIGTPIAASNGLTNAQMSDPSIFHGWNFGSAGAWAMPTGAGHPVLRWQLDPPLMN
jgi:hypothetical protein